jgi:hypothetical protein
MNFKSLRFLSLIGVFALVLAANAAWAQPGMGPGDGQGRGKGGGAPYDRMYNPQTVESLAGEVISVDKSQGKRMSYGVHLTLKTAKETIAVHLGPAWFLEKQAFTIAPGDEVEITGSRTNFNGQPAIIAAAVKKGGQVLKLRETSGVPVWAGQGRR